MDDLGRIETNKNVKKRKREGEFEENTHANGKKIILLTMYQSERKLYTTLDVFFPFHLCYPGSMHR